MIGNQAITLFNTGLPALFLAAAAWVLPALFSNGTMQQTRLFGSVLLSALVLFVGGALLFAIIYSAGGIPVVATFGDNPVALSVFFARLSALASIIWAPVLALAWFVLAQRVEKRKGQRLAHGGAS